MKALLVCIFLLSFNNLYSCDCGKLADLKTQQKKAILQSSLILVGDVISVDMDNGKYLVKVVEVLKGQVVSDTLEGILKTSCSLIPKVGRWIFYNEPLFFYDDPTQNDINKKLSYSVCGLSRSFENPEKIFVAKYVSIVEKPSKKEKDRIFRKNYVSMAEYTKEVEAIKKTAQKDLEVEIIDLRRRNSK